MYSVLLQFTLFWRNIHFVAFYPRLCGAKIYPKILSVEQKWQISCMAMMMTLLSFSSLFIIIPNFIILKHLLCRPWCVASVPGAGAKHLVTPPNIPVATGQSLGPDALAQALASVLVSMHIAQVLVQGAKHLVIPTNHPIGHWPVPWTWYTSTSTSISTSMCHIHIPIRLCFRCLLRDSCTL